MMAQPNAPVSLKDLFAGIDCPTEIPDVTVTDITSDSRNAQKGGLFLACQGYDRHGLEYVEQAIAANVAAVAWEPSTQHSRPELPASVIGLEVQHLGAKVGAIADRFFGQPSAQMTITGVTGTNGKTTVARLASSALTLLDHAAGYMGTLGYGIGDSLTPIALTTPGCIVVHRRLRDLAEQGVRSVVMEVSSHGLDQGRIDGVQISTAAFTNLSRDHLDYHGSLQAYGDAKAKLFTRPDLKTAVINVGDDFGARLVDVRNKAADVIAVGVATAVEGRDVASLKADLKAELLDANEEGLQIRLSGRFGDVEFQSPMWGLFNVENLALAAGILLAHGFTLAQAAEALAQLRAPAGRMQVVRGAKGPTVIVDFAHTPDALEKALKSVRMHTPGKVCCVFGCGGERDQGKRPLMGRAAVEHADHVMLTSDNPRGEDPAQIIADVLAGMPITDTTDVIADRAEAIRTAIEDAAEAEVILIAGKGSEDYQLIGTEKRPFSDVTVATEALGGVH
jgi:UDP-N-acetylmuramoyl-L-alanyl-D-glutamate--2,6-diaminopimelate ligase